METRKALTGYSYAHVKQSQVSLTFIQRVHQVMCDTLDGVI